jgi:hypothetical protein
MRLVIVAILVSLAGCSNYATNQNTPPPTMGNQNDPACTIAADQQHSPGWPFSLDSFKSNVLPTLTQTCATAGCHAAPNGSAGYTAWADAAPGNCSYAKTFTAFIKKVDLTNPTNSAVYVAITGGDPSHPVKLDKADPKATAILSFIQAAAMTSSGPVQTSPPPTSANPFDYTVFQSTIQPILDTAAGKGCTNANCHGAGIAGVKIVATPAQNSTDMQANFNLITSICNLQAPDQSKFYLQATTLHGSGQSAVVSSAQAQSILTWIQTAQKNAGSTGGGGSSPNCVAASNFNADVFQSDIEPILFGTLDLNNPGVNRTTTGCSRSGCHGDNRTGGAFVLQQTATTATNLQNFACFVNIANPTSSPILTCPENSPLCPKTPHPGQNVFLPGNTDLNYQRILSYIYSAKTASSPLDFAFFVRQINPIFQDVNSVQAGAQNRTCADFSCHGVSAAGQPAPNGSVFPILTGSDKTSLLVNFATAANFTNFISPKGSSLFLFPTDDIANAALPFATGLHHPGGLDFADTAPQALSILAWANGLRPDGNGQNPNWLVAGVYPVAQITDPTPIDEINATPQIFDNSGAAQFNAGQWDGLFSPVAKVDLNAEFPGAAGGGRAAFLVAYVINTTPSDIQAQITLQSDNVVKLYVDKNPVQQTANAGGDGAPAFATLPAFANSHKATRLLVKVFQRSTDVNFNLTTTFQDQFGNKLTNTTGELVFVLGPAGGI